MILLGFFVHDISRKEESSPVLDQFRSHNKVKFVYFSYTSPFVSRVFKINQSKEKEKNLKTESVHDNRLFFIP